MTQSKQLLIGRCFCGDLFIAAKSDEYESMVSRHILDYHRDQPIDKSLVTLVEGDLHEWRATT